MGQPQGTYIRQSFTVSSAGAFYVSDDHGNSFSFTVPISASGVSTSTLVGNSTTAVQETKVLAGAVLLADVKLTFSVYKGNCQQAGIRLEISGYENWTPIGSGAVKLEFGSEPISTSGDRAYFGNSSGVALGFDWSDSKALHPSFDNSTRTLSYPVGTSFDIDPVTVATTAAPLSVSPPSQTHLCYASGRYWEFYFDGYDYGFVSSTDGIAWRGETSIATSAREIVSGMMFACSGSTVYRVGEGPNPKTPGWYYDSGVMQSNGTISWGTEEYHSTTDQYGFSTQTDLAVDSRGYVWMAVYDSTTSRMEVWEGPSNWNETLAFTPSPKANVDLVPFSSGTIAMLYYTGGPPQTLTARTWNGSAWSSPLVAAGTYTAGYSSAVAVGDTAEVCAFGTNGLTYLDLLYGGNWSAPKTLDTSSVVNGCVMELDGSGDLAVVYEGKVGSTNTLNSDESGDNGTTWSGPETLLSSLSYVDGPIVGGPLAPALAMATWVSGSTSPYDLEFVAFSPVMSTAATSTDPWSRPGLSPYESYFANFGAFVSPGNGLLTVDQGTLDLPGRGLGLSLSLVYSMPYAFDGTTSLQYENFTVAPMGLGWSLNLPWIGANYVHLPGGQAIPLSALETKGPSPPTYHGVVDFELDSTTNGYTLYMSSGVTYNFADNRLTDNTMALISETEPESYSQGNTISFAYADGRIANITDTVGRVVVFSYNAEGLLSSMSSGGRIWALGYTGADLTTVTDPLGRVTAYQYSTGINPWLISEIIFPTGGKLTYSYGNATVWGDSVKTYYATLIDTYSSPSQLSESQNVTYDIVNGKVVWANSSLAGSSGIAERIDTNLLSSQHRSTEYYEDGSGALQKAVETDSDSLGRTNETKLISPGGTILAHSVSGYDDWGNLVYSQDVQGQQTWYSYLNTDSSGSFGSSGCSAQFYSQTVSAYIHDALAGNCDYQNGSGTQQQQTYSEYDAYGNLVQQKDLHSGGWLYTYYTRDQYGNLLSETNPDGYTTYYRYSSAYGSAYLTKKSTLVGTQNVTTTNTYDFATGDLLSTTDASGYTTSYQYDALGRTTQTTYPAVNGVTATTKYSYDDVNNVLTTTDPDGHLTKAYFDGLARETKVEQWNGTSVYSTVYYTYNWLDQVATKTTAAGNTYTYSYDWDGRLVRLANPDGTYETTSYNLTANTMTTTDELGHQTVYSYDAGQLLTSVREYNGTSTYYLTTYSYDLSGNTLSVTDAKGQIASYQYDDLNRLVKTTFPDGTYETKAYDSVGNLLTRTTANGSTISYSYDALNRLTQVSYPGSGGNVTYTYDPAGNRLSQVSPSASDYHTYDTRGRLTNQTEYVGGAKYSTLYAYDNASNVVQITYPDGYVLSMGYDGVGLLSSVGRFANLTYTVDGQISKIAYGDGEVATYSYDSRDRPTRILLMYGTTKEMDLNYTYDGTGNVLSENSQSYAYDWLDRLTNATGPWGTTGYTYDSVGNRVQMVNGSATTDYTYGSFNRLMDAGGTNYTYNAIGDMVSRNGTAWVYSYDYENRLTNVAHNGVTVQTNLYDGDGNRVEQTTNGGSVIYSYQGVNILYQKNLTSDTVTKSFYAGGIQVAQMVNYTAYYLHQDALGSTRLVTNGATISFSSNFLPYGVNFAMMGEEAFQYTGKLLDEATRLYYEGARYYDPVTGRFITEDSVVGSTSDPMSLNRYMYARDNPMKIVDMDGHEWWNPVADLTTAASDVVGAATDVANSVSNAWNSLPPTDQAIVVAAAVVTVAAVATVVTAGAAAPVLADVAVEEAGDVAVVEAASAAAPEVTAAATAELGADTAAGSSFSLSTMATKSVIGGGINTLATVAVDEVTGTPITGRQLVTSFATGAAGAGLSYGLSFGLQAVGVATTQSVTQLTNVAGGTAATLIDTTLTGRSSTGTADAEATTALKGTVTGSLEYSTSPIEQRIADFGFDFLGGIF